MTIKEFESEFCTLGANYKTKDIDRFSKRLIKENADVSFLRPTLPMHQEYFRTYFQVSLHYIPEMEGKLRFVEEHFPLLGDWWHVDMIVSFIGGSLTFDYAFSKAKEYVQSPMPYVRRLGYVMFIPRLVRDPELIEPLFDLFKNDTEYHVIMAEAWLLSYLAMCDADRTYEYMKVCDLNYAIAGKAIQKICDSYVISELDKDRFKGLRQIRKEYR